MPRHGVRRWLHRPVPRRDHFRTTRTCRLARCQDPAPDTRTRSRFSGGSGLRPCATCPARAQAPLLRTEVWWCESLQLLSPTIWLPDQQAIPLLPVEGKVRVGTVSERDWVARTQHSLRRELSRATPG